VNLDALANGAKIARVHLTNDGSTISALQNDTAAKLSGLLKDLNNPHSLGLNAQEAFFLDDGVVLLEGQEDVIFMGRVQESLGLKLEGELFGWGVGGAEKMGTIAAMLRDLGFRKVVGLLDGDKVSLSNALSAEFPDYRFLTIPAVDIRTKAPRNAKAAVNGLLDDANQTVRAEHVDEAKAIIAAANSYLSGG
jgi:hypothetical protein